MRTGLFSQGGLSVGIVVIISGLCIGHGYGRDRLKLVHADSLVSIMLEQKRVLQLRGDVELVQGEAYIVCDMANWWEKEDRTVAYGNVSIYDGKRTLYADQVHYDGDTRTETAIGHVTLKSGHRQLKAIKIIYAQETEIARAFNNVILTDFIEEVTLLGEKALYDRKADYGSIEGKPYLSKIDTVSNEEMTVSGMMIEAWGEAQRILVSDSVLLEKGKLRAICSQAEYLTDKQTLILRMNPVVWQQDQEMRGDQIDIWLDGTEFRGGVIQGNAKVVSMDSVYQNILEGKTIRIEAVKDTIEKVIVEGQASSIYHIFDEDGNEQGTNTTTGDKIILDFENDRLQEVIVESHPGLCTGLFTPVEHSTENGKEIATIDTSKGY